MTPKEIYKFIIEQSPEPLIKNPVLRKVVDQERLGFYLGKKVPSEGTIEDADARKAEDALSGSTDVMKVADLQRQGHIGHYYADGGRIPFGDGSITQVRNKSKNVIGRNLKLFEKGKLYHLRLGEDKKNFYGTKSELQKIYNKRRKAGGLQVDVTSKKYKDAIPEGYGTNQDLINKMKSKGIYVSDSSYAPSLAKNFNIKTKAHSLVANHNVYDLTKLDDPEFVLKIKEQQKLGGALEDFRPSKTPYEIQKKRLDAIESGGGIKKNDPYSAPRGKGAQLGHTGNIFGTELITGDRLAYTPSQINELMSRKGNLDDKIRTVSARMENIKNSNMDSKAKKEALEQIDTTLIRLASQSDGFKKVTLSSGKTFGGDRLTIDPLDIYPGKTEKEIQKIQKEYLNKKIITEEMAAKNPKLKVTSPKEIQKIQDAFFFEENRKANLKAAQKMSKKEISKTIEKLSTPIKKQLSNNLSKAGFTCSLAEGVDCNDPESYRKSMQETMQKASQGDNAAVRRIQNLGKIMNKVRGAAKATGYGALIEIGFAAPLATIDWARGANKQEIVSNATLGFFGRSMDEQLRDKDIRYRQIAALEDAGTKEQKMRKRLETAGGYRSIAQGQQMLENAMAETDKAAQPFLRVNPQLEAGQMFDQDKYFSDIKYMQDQMAKEQEAKKQRAIKRGFYQPGFDVFAEEMSYAGGGIAGIRRPSAIPPQSGPLPDGLPGVLKRVKNI